VQSKAVPPRPTGQPAGVDEEMIGATVAWRNNSSLTTISPGVGRRRRPIEGRSISHTDSYISNGAGTADWFRPRSPRVRRAAQSVTMMPVAAYRLDRSRGVEIVDGASVSVAVVASRTEAELIVGMLRSHGVSAAVSADDAGGQYPQMQIEGVRVLVAPSDEASARRLLAAADDTLE
jgi:hypothetical protein